MLRKVLALLMVLGCFVSGSMAGAAQVQELSGEFVAKTPALTLVRALVDTLKPESLEVVFAAEPTAEGYIPEIYIEAKGVTGGTPYRLDRFALGGTFVYLTPTATWKASDIRSFEPKEWKGIFNTEIVVKEKDLQNAISVFMSEKDNKNEELKKWSNLGVEFKPGRIHLKGKYQVSGGVSAAFKVKTGLEIRKGKEIWLVDTDVQINNADQNAAIRSELKKRNPPANLEDLNVPLVLRSLSITDKEIRLKTATAPKSFEGITYRYTR